MAQPELPGDIEWPDSTREWWSAWGDDPRTEKCADVDWLYLLDGALLHAAIWSNGDFASIGNLRSHVKLFEQRLKELNGDQAGSGEQTPTAALAMMEKYRKRRKTG
jgi:hypothetical protein